MKTFMSAAHCFLMYGFLAYLLLLFMTEVIDRSPFTNSFLKGGAIFIGMLRKEGDRFTALFIWPITNHNSFD